MSRTASTTPSAARPPTSRSIPLSPRVSASRRQRFPQDATAILDGVATTDPLIANGRPYTIRVRLGDETRTSLDAIQNTVFNSSSGHTASLGSLATVQQLPPQNEIRRENLQRLVVVTGGLEGSDLGTRNRQGPADRCRPAPARLGARGVRRHLRGAAEIVPRSAARAAAGAGAGLRRAADGVPQLPRAHRDSHFFGALDLRRDPGAADHAHHLQRGFVHGTDHGHRHRGQERHPAARRGREIPRRRRCPRTTPCCMPRSAVCGPSS